MKTALKLAALIVGLLALGACVPSLNPFYEAKDVVFESGLLGEWEAKGGNNEPTVWVFTKGEGTGYVLEVREKEQAGKLEAHLFKMGNELFLDLVPMDCEFSDKQADLVGAAMFPGHLLFRVPRFGDTLAVAACDYDWLLKQLEEHPKALAHRKQNKSVLLTAPTKDLQAFVLKHLDQLFAKPSEMTRKAKSA